VARPGSLNIVAGQNDVGEEGSKNAKDGEEHHLVSVYDWLLNKMLETNLSVVERTGEQCGLYMCLK
jgi:hypothetical protein